MKLIYVGDPMCSWCYGFGKEMTALMELHPELELQIVVGGVRAGATDVLDDQGKAFRLGHWARVEAASGLPFNRQAFLARRGFVYDTEPICRAVVAARKVAPTANLLGVFRALQHAFYATGLDTTDGRMLSVVAADALAADGHAVDSDTFHATWLASETIAETRAEFMLARKMGVSSFPALLLDTGKGLAEVSPGYADVAVIHNRLTTLMAQFGSGNQAA